MGVLALAIGSRGEVEPMSVLIAELQRRGVPARIACPRDEAPLARQLGAEVVELPISMTDALSRAAHAARFGAPLTGQAFYLRRWLKKAAPGIAQVLIDEVQPGQTLLSGLLARDVTDVFAKQLACRPVTMLFTGQLPTTHRDSYIADDLRHPSTSQNRLGSTLGWWMQNTAGVPLAREVRALLRKGRNAVPRGSGPVVGEHMIMAVSPLVVPPAPDWPPNTHQTGYLATPPMDMVAPEELLAFLDAGQPPVYVGFGSLSAGLQPRVRGLIPKAARLAGIRVLTPALPNRRVGHARRDVFVTGSVPHSWLFPQMAGVVHHGGAGHTWTALSAGVPSVAVPVGVDQPYHAQRIHVLGVGPAPISAHDLTEEKLATLLLDLTSGAFAARATEIGNIARDEDGVQRTIEKLAELQFIPDVTQAGAVREA